MPDLLDDARQLIQSRLDDLDAEAKRLGRAVARSGEGESSRTPSSWAAAKRVSTEAPASRKPKPRASPKPRGAKHAKRGQRHAENAYGQT